MKHISFDSKLAILVFASIFVVRASVCHADEFAFHHEDVLGTSLELRIHCSDPEVARSAEKMALEEIDRLSEVFSHYSPSSEFARLCTTPPGQSMPISAELARLLKQCEAWTRLSEGAFNPAVEILSQRWRKASELGVLPSDDELKQLASRVGEQHWSIDLKNQSITRMSQLPLSLNAIAKGTILDAVTESLYRFAQSDDQNDLGGGKVKIEGVTINIGGDIRTMGVVSQLVLIPDPNRDAQGASPMQQVALRNQAIATSGPSERYYSIGAHRYSHIIDPRTGKPSNGVSSSSVIAPDAETADALATICCVLPPRAALQLVESLPQVHCYLVTATGERWFSSDWPNLDSDGSVDATDEATKDEKKPEASEHEFLIEFEIAKASDARRYRRPYVAVWVEDQDGFPVKTLSLFLMAENPGPRWHRDLRRWYSSDQMRLEVDDSKLIGTVSKPTRNPGNYKVAWDGRDDHGEPLKVGKYTLYIEAAREHGTYQLMKQAFELGSEDFEEKLKGNVEIKEATITYHRKK